MCPHARALWFISSLLLLLPTGHRAEGQVLLKPTGRNASPLRARVLKAEARIEGQVATTDLDLTFQNELSQRVEADFLYALPPNTVVTDFAYYYGTERVVARVAEKQRAAAIYRYITSRMRDPALIEMVGKSTFRARVFPVMPNADLRVQIRMVQILPSERQNLAYSLPLMPLSRGRSALDSVDVGITVKPDPDVTQVANNYGLPVDREGPLYRIAFTGANFRPQKDLRITLVRRPAPLHASLYAARSGGPDGFFVLALTPPVALTKPAVRVMGVPVFQTVPPRATAGRAVVLHGRYRGKGPATVVLRGRGPGGPVTLRDTVAFGAEAIPNNPAAKLWAAARIEALARSPRNRDAVIALSLRHTVPSKWTSWLAIPREEQERYRAEKARAELDLATRQLGELLVKGQARTPRAVALRARIAEVARDLGQSPKDALRGSLDGRLRELASWVASPGRGPKTGGPAAWRRELALLAREVGTSPEPYLRDARRSLAWDDAHATAARLAAEIAARGTESPAAGRLRRRLDRMAHLIGQAPGELTRNYLNSLLVKAADAAAHERYQEQPNAARLAEARARIVRLERALGNPPGKAEREAESRILRADAHALGDRLYQELIAGRGAGTRAEELRRELGRISRKAAVGGKDPDALSQEVSRLAAQRAAEDLIRRYREQVVAGRANEPEAAAVRQRFEEMSRLAGRDPREQLYNSLIGNWFYLDRAWELVRLRDASRIDRDRIAQMERELERLERVAGVTDPTVRARAIQRFSPYDDPEAATRRDFLAELRKDQPDPQRLRDLRGRLVELTAARRSRPYAEQRIERLMADVELDRVETSDLPLAEKRERMAKLETRSRELRARMGDPMLSIEAPPDAPRVVALMPDGTVKPLEFDPASGRWQARFDIPTYAAEGAYVVTVVILLRDGTRQALTVRYHVDVTPPTGTGQARAADRILRLEVEGASDTSRVTALLPGREPVALAPSAAPNSPGRFFALVPLGQDARPTSVTFVLTDRAHNRTTLTVDVSP